MNPLYIVLSMLLVPLFVLILVVTIKHIIKSLRSLNDEQFQIGEIELEETENVAPLLLSRRRRELLNRNGEFDAFVVYRFDTDHQFVVDTLIPELKDVRKMKSHIHSIDFQPGRKIEENIEEAI